MMIEMKKGTVAGIAALFGLGLAGAAAYLLTRPKPEPAPACASQQLADGTTKFTCNFPGQHVQPVTVDLGGVREVLSISGTAVLTGTGSSTGRSYLYSELHLRGSSPITTPGEEILCKNSPPNTACQISLTPNWQSRLFQIWGLSANAPDVNMAAAGSVEESIIADVKVEVIVR